MKVLAVLCFVAVAFAKREVKKTCTEKPESGMCMAYFPMWYYDPNTQTCNEFVYGGCQGNGNRYATKKECLENCEGVTAVESASSVCELPAETGLCKAYMPRFHFDSVSGQCKGFIYGGCGGNGNNFETEKDCQKACGGAVPERALDRPDCHLKGETGLCKGSFPRFYYDQEEGMCKKFIYGGCGGNRNNFETEFDCYNKCGALLSESPCDQEKVVGPCKAAFPRFFFNKQSGKCESFIYGGCDGNGNNFGKKEQCENTCGVTQRVEGRPDCEKKAETGPCRGSFPRFYYDQEEGMCKKFIYGGCGGNMNNFETEAECQNGCGALLSESPCDQEKVVGPCKAAFPRFFFNKQSGKCESFTYGGCRGNGNNFGKKEECEKTCGVTQRVEGRPDCEKKGETGPCRGSFPRFYYDQEEGMCKKFIYGGCGGNMNNFETEAECENGCGALLAESPCDQEKKVGRCKGAFPRFFFNKQSGKCESFIYGGCGANGNNFMEKDDCENTCGVSRGVAACQQEADEGMCRGYFPMFYFDSKKGVCSEFIYGGCGGNDNKFATEEECMDVCAA